MAKPIVTTKELTEFLRHIDTNPQIWLEMYDENRGYSRVTACVDMQFQKDMDGGERLILKEIKAK